MEFHLTSTVSPILSMSNFEPLTIINFKKIDDIKEYFYTVNYLYIFIFKLKRVMKSLVLFFFFKTLSIRI
jgi:hypothetical protein